MHYNWALKVLNDLSHLPETTGAEKTVAVTDSISIIGFNLYYRLGQNHNERFLMDTGKNE